MASGDPIKIDPSALVAAGTTVSEATVKAATPPSGLPVHGMVGSPTDGAWSGIVTGMYAQSATMGAAIGPKAPLVQAAADKAAADLTAHDLQNAQAMQKVAPDAAAGAARASAPGGAPAGAVSGATRSVGWNPPAGMGSATPGVISNPNYRPAQPAVAGPGPNVGPKIPDSVIKPTGVSSATPGVISNPNYRPSAPAQAGPGPNVGPKIPDSVIRPVGLHTNPGYGDSEVEEPAQIGAGPGPNAPTERAPVHWLPGSGEWTPPF
jgi:hypothetical protein